MSSKSSVSICLAKPNNFCLFILAIMYITYLEVLINLITFQLEVMDLLLIEKLLTEEIVEFFVISGLEIVTNTM